MIETLLVCGGSIYLILGSLHALFTLWDLRDPRRLVPDNPAVAAAMAASRVRLARGGTTMWKAWVGFNFSHSLGALLFGTLSTLAGLSFDAATLPSGALLALALISLIYLILAVLYWFRIPIAGAAVATVALGLAWLLRAFG